MWVNTLLSSLHANIGSACRHLMMIIHPESETTCSSTSAALLSAAACWTYWQIVLCGLPLNSSEHTNSPFPYTCVGLAWLGLSQLITLAQRGFVSSLKQGYLKVCKSSILFSTVYLNLNNDKDNLMPLQPTWRQVRCIFLQLWFVFKLAIVMQIKAAWCDLEWPTVPMEKGHKWGQSEAREDMNIKSNNYKLHPSVLPLHLWSALWW